LRRNLNELADQALLVEVEPRGAPLESPDTPGYAGKYGIPPTNLPFDWVAEGQIAPGADFITASPGGLGRMQAAVSRWSPGQDHSWEVDDG
jgi:hypothetical protein